MWRDGRPDQRPRTQRCPGHQMPIVGELELHFRDGIKRASNGQVLTFAVALRSQHAPNNGIDRLE
jgi:hypothetical protein